MGLSILGIGTAVPGTSVTQSQSLRLARLFSAAAPSICDSLESLYLNSNIQQRAVVFPQLVISALDSGNDESESILARCHDNGGPSTEERVKLVDEAAAPLAIAAISQALDEAQITPCQVTHLLTASSTTGMSPGFDLKAIKELGIPSHVSRTNIGMMMCHAAINGLRVATAFAHYDPQAVVVFCALEICSAHYDFNPSPKKLVPNAIFSDGAAAVVGRMGKGHGWNVDSCAGFVFTDESDRLTIGFGSHGLDMKLSTRVPRLIEKYLGSAIADWLRKEGLSIGDVKSWAIHPGGPRILDVAAASIGIPLTSLRDSWDVLAQYGNMSSPTVLFILKRLIEKDAELPCVAISFGPGLAVECALIGHEQGTRSL